MGVGKANRPGTGKSGIRVAGHAKNADDQELTASEMIWVRMGRRPDTKNSTAMTMTMRPMMRIITLLPVSPIMREMRDEPMSTSMVINSTIATTVSSAPFCKGPWASSISTMMLVMDPGPQSMGMPKGVMEISDT